MTLIRTTPGGPVTKKFVPKEVNFEFYKGDSVEFSVSAGSSTGTAIDMTGWTASGQIRHSDTNAVAPVAWDITNQAGERFLVRLSPTQSSQLSSDTIWKYDIELVDLAGKKKTVMAGTIKTTEDVTQ